MVKLGELTEIARGSSPRPISDQAYFDKGTIPWIKIADATASNRFIYKTKQHVNEYGASFSRKLPAGSLIVAASGTLGFAIFLGIEGCVHDGWLYFKRIDKSKLDKYYLYYLLNTLTRSFNAVSYGAAIQNINTGILKNTEIPLLPLYEQKKIAAILSAYDDLIENNKRRIDLLEKMAEEIYREWFVRFRFPGYQTSEFEKGVPKGWEHGKADQFFEHVKGKSYTSDEISEHDENSMPFVTLKSFNRGGGYRGDGLKSYAGKFSDKQVVFEGDVVMAVTDMTQNREVVGRVARIPDLGEKGAVISLDVIKLVPKTISATYLYSYMKYSGFGDFIKSFANGANVLHLKPDLVTQQVIVVPPEDLRNKFDAFVAPIHERVGVLTKEIENLEETKNSLLPRLISGKLTVADLDIQFPPSMVDDEAA